MSLVAIAIASAARVSQTADLWTFFFAELGVPFHPISVTAPM